MTRYERRQVPAEPGFEIDGRVVEVLEVGANTLTVLVETSTPTTFEDDPEGIALYEAGNPEPVDEVPKKATYFCGAEKGDGGQCVREVDDPEDTCWQHPQEDE